MLRDTYLTRELFAEAELYGFDGETLFRGGHKTTTYDEVLMWMREKHLLHLYLIPSPAFDADAAEPTYTVMYSDLTQGEYLAKTGKYYENDLGCVCGYQRAREYMIERGIWEFVTRDVVRFIRDNNVFTQPLPRDDEKIEALMLEHGLECTEEKHFGSFKKSQMLEENLCQVVRIGDFETLQYGPSQFKLPRGWEFSNYHIGLFLMHIKDMEATSLCGYSISDLEMILEEYTNIQDEK